MSKGKMSKEQLSEKAYKLGFDYESNNHGCAQCTLAAVQDTLGLGDDSAFKGASGLSGGVGRMGHVCGALTGGVIAIGLSMGRERKDFDSDHIPQLYYTEEVAKKLHDKFMEEYGTCNCREIQQKIFGRTFDLWNPGHWEIFEELGGHVDKCPSVVGKAARWTVEIILEEEEKKTS